MGLKRHEQHLNNDYEKWPLEVKQHVACKTKFSVSKQHADLLTKAADTDDYTLRYGHIKTSNASTVMTQELSNNLSVFSEDLYDLNFMFLVTEPNDIVPPHHDPIRTTALYIPLSPLDRDYSPLEFYYKNEIYALDNTDSNRVWVINVNNLHAVFNNEFERFNLQCSFTKIPYAKIVKKYEEYMVF